jgi:hypothetical protein
MIVERYGKAYGELLPFQSIIQLFLAPGILPQFFFAVLSPGIWSEIAVEVGGVGLWPGLRNN